MKVAIIEGTQEEILAALEAMRLDFDAVTALADPPPPGPKATDVLDATAAHFRLREQQLLGRDRSRDVSYARHMAIYLLRHDAGISGQDIKRMFLRDHSTIHEAESRIQMELGTRPETLRDLEEIRLRLTTQQEATA